MKIFESKVAHNTMYIILKLIIIFNTHYHAAIIITYLCITEVGAISRVTRRIIRFNKICL